MAETERSRIADNPVGAAVQSLSRDHHRNRDDRRYPTDEELEAKVKAALEALSRWDLDPNRGEARASRAADL